MQRKMLGVLDLVFQQQQNHPNRNNVCGQIPDLALDLDICEKSFLQGRDHKNRGPGANPAMVINAPAVARR